MGRELRLDSGLVLETLVGCLGLGWQPWAGLASAPLPSSSLPLALILRRTQGDTQGGDYDPILQMGKVRPERAGTCSGIPLSHHHLLPQWKSFS